MQRSVRLVSIKGTPMVIFEGPECISDDIVKHNNFWEFEIFDKWHRYFPSDGLMLDIGANIGSHSLQFKSHFPNLKIWSFEPFPANYKLLKQNTNQYNDVHCFNVGVGSTNSMVHFSDDHAGNSGVVKVVGNSKTTNLVVALDTFKFPEKVTFIKMDIEGHELSALEGMSDLLLNDKPMIWVEDIKDKAVPYLKTLGYKILDERPKTKDYLMI